MSNASNPKKRLEEALKHKAPQGQGVMVSNNDIHSPSREATRGSATAGNSLGSPSNAFNFGTRFGMSFGNASPPAPSNPSLLNPDGGRPANRYASNGAATATTRPTTNTSANKGTTSIVTTTSTSVQRASAATSGGRTTHSAVVLRSPISGYKKGSARLGAEENFASLPTTPRGSKGGEGIGNISRRTSVRGSTPPRKLVSAQTDLERTSSHTPTKRSTRTGRVSEIRTPPPSVDVGKFYQNPSLLSPPNAKKKATQSIDKQNPAAYFDEDDENALDKAELELAEEFNNGYEYVNVSEGDDNAVDDPNKVKQGYKEKAMTEGATIHDVLSDSVSSEHELLLGASSVDNDMATAATTLPPKYDRVPTVLLSNDKKGMPPAATRFVKGNLDRKETRKLQINANHAAPGNRYQDSNKQGSAAENDNSIWTSPDRTQHTKHLHATITTDAASSISTPPPMPNKTQSRSMPAATTPPGDRVFVVPPPPHSPPLLIPRPEELDQSTQPNRPKIPASGSQNINTARTSEFERPQLQRRGSGNLSAVGISSSRNNSRYGSTPPLSPKIDAMIHGEHIPRLAPSSWGTGDIDSAKDREGDWGDSDGAWETNEGTVEAAEKDKNTNDDGAAGVAKAKILLPPTQDDEEDDDTPITSFRPSSSEATNKFPTFVPPADGITQSSRQSKDDAFFRHIDTIGASGVSTLNQPQQVIPQQQPYRGIDLNNFLHYERSYNAPGYPNYLRPVARSPPPPTLRLPPKPKPPAAPAAPEMIDRSGFINVGNSCYASSVLTVLCRNRSFGLHLKSFMQLVVGKAVSKINAEVSKALESFDEAATESERKTLLSILKDSVHNGPQTVVVRKRLSTVPVSTDEARLIFARRGKEPPNANQAPHEAVSPTLVPTLRDIGNPLQGDTEIYNAPAAGVSTGEPNNNAPSSALGADSGDVFSLLSQFQTNTEAHIDADNNAHITYNPADLKLSDTGGGGGSLLAPTSATLIEQSSITAVPQPPQLASPKLPMLYIDTAAGYPLKLHQALLALIDVITKRDGNDEKANESNKELYEQCKLNHGVALIRYQKRLLPQWEKECEKAKELHRKAMVAYHQRRAAPQQEVQAAQQKNDKVDQSSDKEEEEETLIITDAAEADTFAYNPNPPYKTAESLAREENGAQGVTYNYDYYNVTGIRPTDIGNVMSEAGFFNLAQHDAPEFLTAIMSRLEDEAIAFYRWVAFMEAGIVSQGTILSNEDERVANEHGAATNSDCLQKVLAMTLAEVPTVAAEPADNKNKDADAAKTGEPLPHQLFHSLIAFLDALQCPVADTRLLWVNMVFQGALFTTVTCKKTRRIELAANQSSSAKEKKCHHKNKTVDTFVTFSVGLPNLKKEIEDERKKILDAAAKESLVITAPDASNVRPASPYLAYLNDDLYGPPGASAATPTGPSDLDKRIELKLNVSEQKLKQKDDSLRSGPERGGERAYDLKKLILSGMAEDRIDDYKCDQCGDTTSQYLKASFALPMPPTFFINLKRFRTEWDAARQDLSIDKNNCPVKVNRILSFDVENKKAEKNGVANEDQCFNVDESESEAAAASERKKVLTAVRGATVFRHFYVLQGVVNHYGRTPYSGHYVSTFRFQPLPFQRELVTIPQEYILAAISQSRRGRKDKAKRARKSEDTDEESDSGAKSRSSTPPPSSQTVKTNAPPAVNPRRPATRSAPYLASCLITDPFDLRCPYVTLNSQDALARLDTGHVPSLTICKEDQSHLTSLTKIHVEGSTFRHANDSKVTFIGCDAEIRVSSKNYKSKRNGASAEDKDGDNARSREGSTTPASTNEHEVSPLPQRLTNLWFEQESHAYLLSYQLVAILPIDEA